MARQSDPSPQLSISRLDVAAMLFATLLSVLCLAKGAVYDSVVAMALLGALPLLWLAQSQARSVHARLARVGLMLLAGIGGILLLQVLLAGGNDLWTQVHTITGHDVNATLLVDKAAWMQGIGRLLFLVITFAIALYIGASESSARMFFQSLLVSGALCIAITFFNATNSGIPTSTAYSYRHGLVNPNNAAAYLGIMLLVALAKAVRFFRSPATTIRKSVIGMIDGLSFMIVVKGCFILFALLIALAGLMMTGSRGGILFTMLTAALFLIMMACKTSLKPQMRNCIIAATLVAATGMFLWSFANYGQIITNKIETNGVSGNSRFTIFRAVVPMIADHPLLGTGLGSFPGAFQPYRPANMSADGIIDKAHNSYLEFAAEMGLPAFAILMTALGWAGTMLVRGFKERKERYVMPGLGVAVWLFAALYSLVDFPLQIPAIAALFVAILTVCVSQTDRRFSEPAQRPTSTTPKKRVRIRKRGMAKPIV